MARFKATIEAANGRSFFRLGSKVATAITGLESGVEVRAEPGADGVDEFQVFATGGRTGLTRFPLGIVRVENGMVSFQPTLSHQGRRLL